MEWGGCRKASVQAQARELTIVTGQVCAWREDDRRTTAGAGPGDFDGLYWNSNVLASARGR